MIICIPPAPFHDLGYSWHLYKVLFSEDVGKNFYKVSFSPEENDIIKKFDSNITKLGLLDCSFLYSLFNGNKLFIKQAKNISEPLTFVKRGKHKIIECFPIAVRKEIDAAVNCKWEKNNVMIEAESTNQFESESFLKGVNSAAFSPEEGGVFKIEYSTVKKRGLFNFLDADSTTDFCSDIQNLTDIEEPECGPENIHNRQAKNCYNLFQFSKLLFHNQILFEKNIFETLLCEVCSDSKNDENTNYLSFSKKIKNIYEQFNIDSNLINNLKFDFIKNNKYETLENPNFDFSQCHFKFRNRYLKHFFSFDKTCLISYLVEEADGFHIYWKKEEGYSMDGEKVKEIGEFIKFYLSFCSIVQTTAREFLSEMLTENI